MNSELVATNGHALAARNIESLMLQGDLSRLSSDQKLSYYKSVCDSLGLNPLTQPFAYIKLNGKEVLYAKRDCTEQLRKIHSVSIAIVAREVVEDLYIVTARATDRTGRTDESVGAVNLKGLAGENRANAIMKAETKAKRRVTLSICGLGLLDETEVDSIPPAQKKLTEDDGSGVMLDESYNAQLARKEIPIEPLENPWLYKIKRHGKEKYLYEVDPRWFVNIDARYGHGQMTAEEYVNARACTEHPELKEIAIQTIIEESEDEQSTNS